MTNILKPVEIVKNDIPAEEDRLYKKIFFEKNMYDSVCEYLKNFSRIYIVTSPTPRNNYLQCLVNVMKENNIVYWITVLNSHPICDNDTILKTCSKVNAADLIVSFGAGTVTDIVKLTAHKLNLPYCVIPTAISHYGLFNNVAYLIENNVPNLIKTNYPEKVFIDESIIKKSPEKFILSSVCFCISLAENVFVLKCKSNILGENETDTFALTKKIKKTEELINWVSLSKDIALLNLMDYIIDLSEICKDTYDTNSIIYSFLLNCSTLKNNFGEKCLLASSVLLNLYSSFFSHGEIYVKDMPEREKVIKIYSKKCKIDSFFEDYMKKTEKFLNSSLHFTINSRKEDLIDELTNLKSFLSKFSKKVLLLKNNENMRMIDENELYSSLELLPFVYENFLLNILTRYGFMNVS